MPTAHDVLGNMGESLVFAEDDQTWNEIAEAEDDEDTRDWADNDLWKACVSPP